MRHAEIPDSHPVKQLFRTLTERGLSHADLRDKDILFYLANLLVDFLFVENLYRIRDADDRRLEYLFEMLQQATATEMPVKKTYYKHIGDFSLFTLGMFPESLQRPRRAVSTNYYTDAGRIGYQTAGELESNRWATTVFRKLAGEFDRCVLSLNWVREYTADPFYQYMFREFDIT
jgi:hypothetical protein